MARIEAVNLSSQPMCASHSFGCMTHLTVNYTFIIIETNEELVIITNRTQLLDPVARLPQEPTCLGGEKEIKIKFGDKRKIL